VTISWSGLCLFLFPTASHSSRWPASPGEFHLCFRLLCRAVRRHSVLFPSIAWADGAVCSFFISYAPGHAGVLLLIFPRYLLLFAFEYLATATVPARRAGRRLRDILFCNAVSVSALFSHQHLHGQGRRGGLGSGVGALSLGCSSPMPSPGSCWRAREEVFLLWWLEF